MKYTVKRSQLDTMWLVLEDGKTIRRIFYNYKKAYQFAKEKNHELRYDYAASGK